MRQGILARAALSVVVATAIAALSGFNGVLAASSSTTTGKILPDPVIGPHARQDALHRNQSFNYAPAKTAVIPRSLALHPTLSPRVGRGMTAAAAAVGPSNTGSLQREVLGFATYWELGNEANWNYGLLSTLAYFGLDVKSDGNFDTSTTNSGWNGWNSQNLVDAINRAHSVGDRAVLVIKVPPPSNTNICSIVYGSGQTAINNTINAIRSKSLDGVNVDFEGSNTTCPNGQSLQAGFTSFVAQLSSQVHQAFPGSYVTVDTYSGSASWDGGQMNIGQLAPVVDGLFDMAYDMASGNMPGQAGPNAPLNGWTYNDTTSVSQYLTKAPASKLILGVPYYGYKWSVTSTTSPPPYASTGGSSAEADTYAGIQSDFSCAQQLTKSWDTTAQSPWASWWSPASGDPCGGNHNSWRELYYDDATSLALKYDLVNANDLQGTGMWALGFDNGYQDLWQVLAEKFLTAWPGQLHPLAPARILDTRNGTGGYGSPVGSNQAINVTVTGRGGVPTSGVAAVVLNVTAVSPNHSGFLTVYPTGNQRPAASNLNFVAGQIVPNLVQVAVGKEGKVSVYNLIGSTNVVIDVAGWISTAPTTSGNLGRYQPLVPSRLLDTRNGTGGFSAPLGPGQSIDLQVTGRGGVPLAGASAVVLNLTVTGPTNPSFLTAYPTGSGLPLASNLNYVPNQTVANRAIVQLGDQGKVSLYNKWGNVNVVVDVGGWFSDSNTVVATGQFTGLAPARIVDTRIGLGLPHALSGGSATITVAGAGGVPTSGVTAVVLNVTVTNPNSPGYVTIYPGGTLPLASDVNYAPGQTVPNLVVATVSANGTISAYIPWGQADLVVDVFGYYS